MNTSACVLDRQAKLSRERERESERNVLAEFGNVACLSLSTLPYKMLHINLDEMHEESSRAMWRGSDDNYNIVVSSV